MTIPNDRPEIESKEDMMAPLPWPMVTASAGMRKRNYRLGELRLAVVETIPDDSIVQITLPTTVEIKETTTVPDYSWIIDRIREAIRNVHDELQAFLDEYSRSSFESFLSSIGSKSKNQDPLLDAPHETGIYFILLREEMDFLSGKPFYIGYAKNLNKRMHDLFPDENGKYQHELSTRMLEDVLKRSTPPGEGGSLFLTLAMITRHSSRTSAISGSRTPGRRAISKPLPLHPCLKKCWISCSNLAWCGIELLQPSVSRGCKISGRGHVPHSMRRPDHASRLASC